MRLDKVAQLLKKVIYPTSRMLNGVGVTILAIMMFFTAADVTLRYVFNRPITGSLELTEFMMAAVVAFGLAYTASKKAHVNIDMLITRFSPRTQAFINSITCLISLGIFALVTWQTILYAQSLKAGGYTTGVLRIPTYPFVWFVVVGAAILCLVLLVNLLEYLAQLVQGVRWQVWAVLVLGIVVISLLFTIPTLGETLPHINPITTGYFGVALLIVLLFSGMPIGVVMALIGFLGMAYVNNLQAATGMMGSSPYSTSSSYGLSVVPLFVLMGEFCFYSGLSQDLYYTVYKWLGHLPGGMAMATVGACAGFAAVSGSSVATAVTMGSVSLPEMKKYRYDPGLSTGCIAAGGTIGILIPPSIPLVIYGILTEQSIGKLLLAGFIPGIIQSILYIITIYVICRRNPMLGPPGARANLKDRLASLKSTWGVLALFVLVIGGIYMGVFTPTEAAGVGAFGALVLALIRRQLRWKSFSTSLLETGRTTAMTLLMLIGAIILGYFLAVTRLPASISTLVAELPVNRYVILLAIVMVYIILGMIISSMGIIVLTIPIFFPVIVALGFDPIWFGILVVILAEIAMISPPVAINVFVIQGMAKDVPMNTVFRGVMPFLYASVFQIILLTIFPQIVTFLPNLMK